MQLQFSADFFPSDNYSDVIVTLFQHENETSKYPQHVIIDLSLYLIADLNTSYLCNYSVFLCRIVNEKYQLTLQTKIVKFPPSVVPTKNVYTHIEVNHLIRTRYVHVWYQTFSRESSLVCLSPKRTDSLTITTKRKRTIHTSCVQWTRLETKA